MDLVKVRSTPELAALAAQRPDFSARPSLKHAADLAALQASGHATLTAAPGRESLLFPTIGEQNDGEADGQ